MHAWISWYCTICELRKFVSTNFRLTKKKKKKRKENTSCSVTSLHGVRNNPPCGRILRAREEKKKSGVREQVEPHLSFFTNVSPSPSFEFSTYHSLPLYLSFRLLSVPLALPLARSSLYSVSLSHFLSFYITFSSSHSHLCTSAFLTAERRTGFRRKETTIRRIVATDHSWRVDRINDVS